MHKEKRSAIVLSILSIVFTAGACVLLFFAMKFAFGTTQTDVVNYLKDIMTPIKSMLHFGSISTVTWNHIPSLLIYCIVTIVLAALWLIFWIIHFVVLLAKRRPSALFPNLVWLVIGIVTTGLFFVSIAQVNVSGAYQGFLFNGEIGGKGVSDYFSFILATWQNNWSAFACGLVFGVLVLVSYLLGFIGTISSLKDVVKYPGVKKVKEAKIEKENKKAFEEKEADYAATAGESKADEAATGDGAIRSYQYAELDDGTEEEKKAETIPAEAKDNKGPVIVQHISYAAPEAKEEKSQPAQQPATAPYPPYAPYPYAPYPYPFYPYAPYPYPPFQAKPEEKKEEPKEEVKPAPEAKPSVMEDRPLTAKELRAIMREELNDHDHPEELEPLTDEQARDLIKEELKSYYAGMLPKEEEAAPEEKAEPAPEPAPVTNEVEEDDLMTSDDLRDLIKETVQNTLAEQPKEEPAPVETLKADEVRQVVAEELEKQPKPVEGLRADEVRQVVAEELEKQPKGEEGIKADEVRQVVAEELEKQPKYEEGLKADDVRAIVREELEATKVEPKDSDVVLSTKDLVAENNAQIKEAAEKQLTGDEVRSLIAEELAKYFAENKLVAKEEPAPVEEKKESPTVIVNVVHTPETKVEEKKEEEAPIEVAPVEEPVEAPVAEPAPEAPAKAPIIRIPFAERMLSMDEDMKDNYNELKAEALAYGLKSRISNSGDTFRLHTKTYLKLTVAGKGLKLYFALDPKDYRDTPIPVKDVGAKNIYREIPLCFKVKSALSLKRAKQLIADVVAKDHLEKGEVAPYDYVAQLRDYHESKDEQDEMDDED